MARIRQKTADEVLKIGDADSVTKKRTREVKPIVVEEIVSEGPEQLHVQRVADAPTFTEMSDAEKFAGSLTVGTKFRLIRILAEGEIIEEKRNVVKKIG